MNYSRQREAIKHFLASRKDHPTAETVYNYMKEEFPNISLATVYRNLNLLVDINEAQKIGTPTGGDRFDGNPAPHYHFFCTNCNCVMDMEISPFPELNTLANRYFNGHIEGHRADFYGLCPDCYKNNNDY